MTPIDLSDPGAPVNCITDRVCAAAVVVLVFASGRRAGFRRAGLAGGAAPGLGACCSSGVRMPAMNRCQSRSRASRSSPKARRKAARVRSPRGSGPAAAAASPPSSGSAHGVAQQVQERQELLGVPGPQVIHQGPGLGVQVAVVAAAEARVPHQPLQPRGRLHAPPVGQPEIVGPADPRPSSAADQLELRRQSLVQPVGKRVVPR